MGPYCDFCGNRCFVRVPEFTPQAVVERMKKGNSIGIDIFASCVQGKARDKESCGYDIDDLRREEEVEIRRLAGDHRHVQARLDYVEEKLLRVREALPYNTKHGHDSVHGDQDVSCCGVCAHADHEHADDCFVGAIEKALEGR